jgi:hypothetical protein
MGTKTDEYLSSLLNDSFKREIDSDEAVWRSLPFFGAMLGLAIALLPAIYRSAAELADIAWRLPIYVLLGISILCFAIAAGWFWVVIRTRLYRYPSTDLEILAYGEALRGFHRARGSAEEQDEMVRNELRAFILEEFAQTTTNNRRNNIAKLRARSQVLLFAMAGFLVAFFCEATILASQAFSPVSEQGNGGRDDRGSDGASGRKEGSDGRACPPADAAGTAVGQGGRELLRTSGQGCTQGVSDTPAPTPTPAPQPPERPAPQWLKRDQAPSPHPPRQE